MSAGALGAVLITGAGGFIGRALAAALDGRCERLALVVRPASRAADAPPGAVVCRADLRDPAAVRAAVEGVELVFHLAANANTTRALEDPRHDFETNVVGTFNLLEAAWRARVRRVVYVSSAAVYGAPERCPLDERHPTQPFTPYGASKLAGELSCRAFHHAHGLETLIARPFGVYGPGEDPARAMVEPSRFLRWHLNGMPIPVLGDPERKTRDFVHVDDVVTALCLLAERGRAGEVYNVGSGDEVSMVALARQVGDVVARPARIEPRPEVLDDTYRLVADISKLRALGYVPAVTLERGLRALAEHLGTRPAPPGVGVALRAGQRPDA